MKLHAFTITLLLAIPSFAMADKAADKTTDKPAKTEKVTLSPDDITVAAHLKHVNEAEVQMGKLAQANGSPGVKAYGGTLVKDHTANNKKLAALAKQKGVTIPAEEITTDEQKAEDQAMKDAMTKMKTLKGVEFDREFLVLAMNGHDREVGRIDNALGGVKDADLRTFLEETKPVVQRHADAARELQKKTTTSMK